MLAITHQQALVDYLALGSARSLRGLRRHYDKHQIENAPSFACLAVWSNRYGWYRAAIEHDEFVGNALVARLRETAIERQFDRATALIAVAQRCLDAANDLDIDPATLSASDIRALVSAAIEANRRVTSAAVVNVDFAVRVHRDYEDEPDAIADEICRPSDT